MSSKKGIEMSLNMIVIVVIAIVFLGIAIALITSWGEKIDDEIPKLFTIGVVPYNPTEANPVLLTPQPLSVDQGEDALLELYVYNYADSDVECTISIIPATQENPVTISHSTANRPIPVGMVGQWLLSVEVPRNAPTGAILYTSNINCGSFTQQEDLAIQVE